MRWIVKGDMAYSDDAGCTIGVEEEFFLVESSTLDCVFNMPQEFEREASSALGSHFARENAASMVELVSGCHRSLRTLRSEMRQLRSECARIADRHGLALLACATHPFSNWQDQARTPDERYETVAHELQMLSARGHTCGLHVHVGISDANTRLAVLNAIQPYLPLLLCLSTSSPFWRGISTGLKSYRTAVNNEGPRSGLPGTFLDTGEYEKLVGALTSAGLIPDESYLWWLIRPSNSYPTLELRVTDCCTDLEDAMGIAALYRALVHALAENGPSIMEPWRQALIQENLWQAVRHGCRAKFVDSATLECKTAFDTLRDTLKFAEASASRLCVEHEMFSVLDVFVRKTSAEKQVEIYENARAGGSETSEALLAVAQSLTVSTAEAPVDDEKLIAA
jgi:glutamate---cysteine ligase / carboxylate-amine ligase